MSAHALTGVSVGAKVGSASYSGEVLPQSDDIGSELTFGLVFVVGTLPMIDFEVRGDYFSKDFDYSYDAGGSTVTTGFEFRDVSLKALARKDLFAPPASPLAIFAGAGVGMHWLNTEVANAAAAGAGSFSEAGKTTKMSGLGMIGLEVAPPALPLSLFAQADYEMVFASERISIAEFSGGLMLRF